MTNRIFIDPDSVPEITPDSSPEDIANAFNELRQAVVDMFQFIEPFRANPTGDYETGDTPIVFLVMENTASAEVTFYKNPKDGYEIIIHRTDAAVTMAGNGKTADVTSIASAGDTAHMKYDEENETWWKIN